MSSTRDKIMTAVFVVFIFAMLALFIVLPKTDTSVNEKRTLAGLPEFSIKSVFSGTFENNVEDYLTDHFPFRDGFVAANSYFELASGRNGVSGIYKGKDGYLINTPVKNVNFDRNATTICEFASKSEIPVTVMIVPTVGGVMSDRLPKNHAPYQDKEFIDKMYESLAEFAETVDLVEVFDKLSDEEQLYYKTDHHWTSSGAYEAYMAIEPDAYDAAEFEIESYDGFYGTSYSKSALWLEDSENVELWTYPANITVTIDDGGKRETYSDMFFREHLDEADKYPVFLNGNHAYTRIENHDVDGGRLLMVKDSYGNSLAPFLARHYNIVDMVDLRYFTETVTELANREKYDKILIVYGLSTVAETTDINMLE